MHCRELVDLAALVAVHGQELIQSSRLSRSAVEQYWAASKVRHDGWSKSVNDFLQWQRTTPPLVASAGPVLLAWRAIRPIVEEILVAEVLTRVWTAVVCCNDRRHSNQLEPIVRSAYAGHLAARNRALHVLVYGRGCGPQEAVELNRLRRRCERWSDLLLGYLVEPPVADGGQGSQHFVQEFAFESQRPQEFARDLSEDRQAGLGAEQMLCLSLNAAFSKDLSDHTGCAAQNQAIALAILACLPGELFDSTVPLQSPWLDRLWHVADDTESMIEEMLALENSR